MLMGMVRPIKISSLLPHTPAKIPLVKSNSNIGDADFSFSYQDLMFFITKSVSNPTKGLDSAGSSSEFLGPKCLLEGAKSLEFHGCKAVLVKKTSEKFTRSSKLTRNYSQ
jgi:hypothetical protein